MKKTIELMAVALGTFGLAAALSVPAHAQDQARPEISPMSRVPALRAEKAKEGSTDRVFGGKEAAKGAWPFQVALLTSFMLDDDPQSQTTAQFCGGSLISAEWVLTAAHCLVNGGAPLQPGDVTVLSDTVHLAEGQRIEVAEVIVHDGYDDTTLDNDIGLLRLAQPASAEPVATTDGTIDSGPAIVTGWGLTENGTFPPNLMEASIDLQTNDACNSGIKQIYQRDLQDVLRQLSWRMRYSEAAIEEATRSIAATMSDPLTDNMLCAGIQDGARDACNGDSGGPLFAMKDGKPVQVGVVSWGAGPMNGGAQCGHENAYGIYTRLDNYRDWIAEKTGM